MKKDIPTPLVATVIVAFLVIVGLMAWRASVPATVIVPKGKMPPPPDYRLGGRTQDTGGKLQLAPPNFGQGGQ